MLELLLVSLVAGDTTIGYSTVGAASGDKGEMPVDNVIEDVVMEDDVMVGAELKNVVMDDDVMDDDVMVDIVLELVLVLDDAPPVPEDVCVDLFAVGWIVPPCAVTFNMVCPFFFFPGFSFVSGKYLYYIMYNVCSICIYLCRFVSW